MPEQGQATELQIWMDKLREAVKREKAELEQEGDGERCLEKPTDQNRS